MAVSPGVDRHIEAFATDFVPAGGGPAARRYLVTSPEHHMKRLLVDGSGPIAQVGRVFRNGEVSDRHNPEFTLAEWYRPGWSYAELMDEVEDLVAALAARFRASGPPERPFRRVTVAEAFRRSLGIDPHRADGRALRAAAARTGVDVPPSLGDDADAVYFLLLATVVEPALPRDRPVFLVDYPVAHAALARVRPGPVPVAERFELFLSGVEIANGFSELTDPDEQRRRYRAENRARAADGRVPYPEDEAFLGALARGLPECAGVALGVDRLVMWLLGAGEVGEVIAFPFE